MSATTTTPSLSLSNFRPRFQNLAKTHHLSPLPSWSVIARRRNILSSDIQQPSVLLRLDQSKTQLWRFSATPEEISQEIVSSDTSSSSTNAVVSSQDGVALIIQVLLIIAFLVLTVLTIGVVYIGVTDFLGKKETEKFEKAEAAKKSKKGGKKKAMRAKAGPRGFGQKIEDDDFDIDLE